jgi:LuxR family transcriptional regulator, quorum-sensing system regulator SolR
MMQRICQDAYQEFSAAKNEQQLLQTIASFGERLGFEHCCYGIRIPVPVSKPAVVIFDTYPRGWMEHYKGSGFLDIDPTVSEGMRSGELIVWPESIDNDARRLWSDARDFGLVVGVAHSSWGAYGVFGLLTLSRHTERLSPAELVNLSLPMSFLANLSHSTMSRLVLPKLIPEANVALTAREREVLSWTGDGKTANEIGTILNISERTVNFHVNNLLTKLTSVNKVQAVVKAMTMGLIYSI